MTVQKSIFCKGCWRQMHAPIPIRGPLSIPLRVVGIKVSQMNPNLCTICETMFTRVKKKKQVIIPATVLFADLRGYTSLSERTEATEVMQLLHRFYDECAAAVWERDGIINKFIGDAVLAIFNFPLTRDDHVEQAVLAAMEIQRRCADLSIVADGKSPVGIGIHTGMASIGEVGTAYKDFTIIGPVVNLASRIQGAAGVGEILVTDEVYRQVHRLFPQAAARTCQLKGIEQPVNAHLLRL